MENEDIPCYIADETPIALLSPNISSIYKVSLTLESRSLMNLPGGWLYQNYEKGRLSTLKLLHVAGFSLQIFCYLLTEIWVGFDHSYSNSPFSTDPIFSTISWGVVCVLGATLLPVLFSGTRYSISLLTEKSLWPYYLAYILLAIFFLAKRFKSGISGEVICTVSLSFLLLISMFTYRSVRRITSHVRLTWMEYFGGKVLYSMILCYTFLSLLKLIVQIVFEEIGSDNQELLGWNGDNWVIFLMTFVFGTGVIALSAFSDQWFPSMISFYFFGMYSCQIRYMCRDNENTCSDSIQITALVLGCILPGFILISALYSWMKHKEEDIDEL